MHTRTKIENKKKTQKRCIHHSFYRKRCQGKNDLNRRKKTPEKEKNGLNMISLDPPRCLKAEPYEIFCAVLGSW
jgi:hypothetical protein